MMITEHDERLLRKATEDARRRIGIDLAEPPEPQLLSDAVHELASKWIVEHACVVISVHP